MSLIKVSEYDLSWPCHFQVLHDKLWPYISDIALSIEHVGSTSVKDLAAKPIIDITIVVSSSSNLKVLIDRMDGIGIKHRGDLGISGREAFTRLPGFYPHNLYACAKGNPALKNHLTVRDCLKLNPDLVKEYSDLKKSLALKHPDDIDAYVEGKSPFLLAILQNAGFNDSELSKIEDVNRKQQQLP